MLKKQHRLQGKQIQFLMGRGKKIYGKYFVCIYFPQRQHILYTQRSVSVPVKLDKRATMRNRLRRHAKHIFVSEYNSSVDQQRWQCFVFLNKQCLEALQKLIASDHKTAILSYRQQICQKDFQFFLSSLGKLSTTSFLQSKPGSRK